MTQHHHTPPPDPMPLDPEERALAERLARLGPHGEPSPALDARVLAAAHAATAGGTRGAAAARARGWRGARWPVGAGVAASVALAAAIAWQMRPLPAPIAPPRETAMRATDPNGTTSALLRETVAQPSPMPPPPPPEARAADAAFATEAAPADAAARAGATAKALAPPPFEEPPVVFDTPSPAAVAAPPPAPPAPMTDAAAADANAPASAPAPPAPVPQSSARAAKPAAQSQSQSASMTQDALPVFDAEDADAPATDVPPATAASPEVRDAWLARIRELAAAGRDDEARASLAEFRRRYPAFAIPADLRPLLPPAPAPAPAPATRPR